MDLKTIQRRNRQDGIGGALVGVRKTTPLEPFSPLVGVTAPVTAVLDFNANDVTLTLIDPAEKPKARVAGRERNSDADFSAPLGYYPQKSELWEGLVGAVRASRRMGTTGLYMLQPYHPDRIPLIFVHGLISTPRMWRNVINELETDPVLRERYQCWVFSYPTGNPPLYSSLRFREELEKFRQLHPDSRDYVLVGHSMGGLVSRTQVTTFDREAWDDAMGKVEAKRLPNSIDGLAPRNPTLKVLDARPMTVPHHSIIGDRGKGDTPASSDGVVNAASLAGLPPPAGIPWSYLAFRGTICTLQACRLASTS